MRPGRREARAARAASPFGPDGADPELVARLREWRRRTALDAGVPAYVVFPDETLRSIAAQRPASREGLAHIPGLGPGRLDRYGAAVLALCAEPSGPAGADDEKAGSRA
jgi:DNA helicase-2/ATP-dependent DNA helicase PcrA